MLAKDDGELDKASTIRKFRIVRQEGKRQVQRDIDHYNLDMMDCATFALSIASSRTVAVTVFGPSQIQSIGTSLRVKNASR